MLSPSFGVCKSWHDQFCTRLLRQHASWLSEAEVLGLGEHFSEAPRLIADAWLKLQLKKRWHEIGEGPFPLSDSFASTFAR